MASAVDAIISLRTDYWKKCNESLSTQIPTETGEWEHVRTIFKHTQFHAKQWITQTDNTKLLQTVCIPAGGDIRVRAAAFKWGNNSWMIVNCVVFPGVFCNGTFDKFVCWPHSLPGNVSVSCPSYLPWISSGQSWHFFYNFLPEWFSDRLNC